MKRFNRALAFVVAVFLIAITVMPVAAATGNKETYAGKTVTVTFSYDDCYSLDGQFSVNDPKGIIEGTPEYKLQSSDGITGQVSGDKCFLYDTNNPALSHDVVVCAVVTIKATAQVGDSCQITFAYNRGTEGTGMDVQSGTDTATITIKEEPEVDIEDKINYEELKKQISIAESLNKNDYTADSWKALEEALANGKDHLNSKDQAAVDQAAKDLADAIAALVKMDYSKLEEAIANGNDLIDNDELGKLWEELIDAIANGNGLLGSGDQEAVDAAADNILRLIDELKKALEEANKQTVVEPGTCEHHGPFCNIKIHKLWPILFFISLAGNIVLVFFLIKKKKSDEK